MKSRKGFVSNSSSSSFLIISKNNKEFNNLLDNIDLSSYSETFVRNRAKKSGLNIACIDICNRDEKIDYLIYKMQEDGKIEILSEEEF